MGAQSRDRAKTTPAVMCIKILLQIFNLLYLIIGACVLGIGIWTQVQLKTYAELTNLYYANSAYIMIGVGTLILLVALGGFYCTAKDKIAPLYMYAVFIALIAIMQIGAGIAAGVFSKKLDNLLETGLKTSIKSGKDQAAWNEVQQYLHCCGVDNPSDWINLTQKAIPASCYKDNKVPGKITPSSTTKQGSTTKAPTKTTTAAPGPPAATTSEAQPTTTNAAPESSSASQTNGSAPTTAPSSAQPPQPPQGRRRRATEGSDTLFNVGCHQKIVNSARRYLGVIVGVCVGFVVLQVIGVILACCLAKKTSKNNYEQIY